jgi:hypothetical protein
LRSFHRQPFKRLAISHSRVFFVSTPIPTGDLQVETFQAIALEDEGLKGGFAASLVRLIRGIQQT